MSTNNQEDTRSIRFRNFLAELEGKLIELEMWAHSALTILSLLEPPGRVLDDEAILRAKLNAGRLEVYIHKLAEGLPGMMVALSEELARYPEPVGEPDPERS